jgi:hypothetical protein
LLDGAHNSAGAEVLRMALQQNIPAHQPTMILGILGDKDWRAMCEILAPLAARILVVPVSSDRTAQPQQLAETCRFANPDADVQTCADLAEAIEASAGDPFVVIAGSLYLIGTALTLLDPEYRDAGDERALNEWAGTHRATLTAATKIHHWLESSKQREKTPLERSFCRSDAFPSYHIWWCLFPYGFAVRKVRHTHHLLESF